MNSANRSAEILIDGRPAVTCQFCKRPMSWARVSDGVCVDCFASPPSCDHDGVKANPEAWAALRLVGVQDAGDSGPLLELRDCPHCSSTLAIEVPARAEAA